MSEDQRPTIADLEAALHADRTRREAQAREELAHALADIQTRNRVDPVSVLRVLPNGAVVPAIEFRAR